MTYEIVLDEWQKELLADMSQPMDTTTQQAHRLIERLTTARSESKGSSVYTRLTEAVAMIKAQDKTRLEIEADRQQRLRDLRERNDLIIENGYTMRRMQEQIIEKDSYIAELQEEIEYLRRSGS